MLRLFLHQMNATVGDTAGNLRKVAEGLDHARGSGADIYITPECALPGYPAEDLLFTPSFIDANRRALEELGAHTKGLTAIIGIIHREDDLFNAAAIFSDGELKGFVKKMNLPNYGLFDEHRYFQAGTTPVVVKHPTARIGITICEDIWFPSGPARDEALWGGADIIINLSASPYHSGKVEQRERMLSTRAADNGVFLAFCNMVGGQDEMVFDGHSALFSPEGEVLARALPFEEDYVIADVPVENIFHHRARDPRRRVSVLSEKPAPVNIIEVNPPGSPERSPLPTREILPISSEEEVYRALVTGCRDYTIKNGFEKVLLGLSGGIDSALTASIAVDALGSAQVVGVTMPSRYSSKGSVDDSEALAKNLGIEIKTIPIEGPFNALLESLAPHFEGRAPNVAEENLQARVRGTLLMALSNKFGWLLLSTGNKSESSVGYCTLYGDMAGGFDVLKDVPKTLVYALSRWRNGEADGAWIPVNTIEKEPSAELAPDQLDSDSLPPYEVLDPILKVLIEEEGDIEPLAEKYGEEVVHRVAGLVDRNEYKRRQTPPGVRITPRAFGKDRRFPITSRHKRVSSK
ncbi:MAG: NAD+ synthase [Deltaproteobacteria bacterium]|nr:MAG: NAD+ synthase [Deltaproteobacteria bacterium]